MQWIRSTTQLPPFNVWSLVWEDEPKIMMLRVNHDGEIIFREKGYLGEGRCVMVDDHDLGRPFIADFWWVPIEEPTQEP